MRLRFTVTVVVAVVALTLGACGGQKDTGFNKLPTPKGTGTGGGSATEVKLVSGNRFEPQTFQAKAGAAVVWINTDPSQPHNVVSDTGLFDSNPQCLQDQSKCMKDGETFTFTFKTPGKYPYYCVIHGTKGGVGMSGVVEVA